MISSVNNFISSYVPSYIKVLASRYHFSFDCELSDGSVSYIVPSDVVNELSDEEYYLGISQNRSLVIKALLYCLSFRCTPFDYVVLHRGLDTFFYFFPIFFLFLE